MEIRVTALGTSGSSPTKERSMPSVAITYNGEVLLLDCGEGAQMQMLRYGINFSRINAIFISHAHGDHVIGVAGLIRTLAMNRRNAPLDIYIPKGYERVIRSLIEFDKAFIGYKINIYGISAGRIFKGKGFTVEAFRLNHTIASTGFVFAEDDRRRFIEEKCKRLGIKGEMHSVIEKQGKIRIGKRVISIADVTTLQKGKKIVYASDTRPCKSTEKAAKGADLLIHESSYSENEKALAKERKHSTAMEAALIAKNAHARKLALTHISARYSDAKALENEARKIFKNTSVLKDGDIIIIYIKNL